MHQLVPCPNCDRHVRQNENACPFCSAELMLQHLAPPVLPRGRLGRAATFAFGASLVGATSLVACGGESETDKPGGGGATSHGGSNSAGHAGSGGSRAGSFNGEGGNIAQPYGVPPFGGSAQPTYGAPPFGGSNSFGGTAGTGGASGGGGTSGAGDGGTGDGGDGGDGGAASAGTTGIGGQQTIYGGPP